MNTFIPKMIEVRQSYPPSPQLDFPSLLEQQFTAAGVRQKVTPGMRIAVGVGSRGVSNLKEIVKATVDVLKAAGAKPFIIPAMGSHGGATPDGQLGILAGYGVTPESMGVPIEAAMEARRIGSTPDGFDVLFSVPGLEADAIVVINRVKPHTDFRGPLGSGVQKMLVIGFGKQAGANNTHRAAVHVGYEHAVREFSKVILNTVPVLCGVGIVEDQHHQTAEVEVLAREQIVAGELRLLVKARSLMARLPLDEVDFLIVDEMGKEVSGTGMDTNVINRDVFGYTASLRRNTALDTQVHRIFVRDLSHATHGNATGIGLADFTTIRAVKAFDTKSTYMNALTSIGILAAKIPIYFDTDREAIQEGLATLASDHPEKLRVVRIFNTLSLDRILVSECCAELLSGLEGVSVTGSPREMQFDQSGNLLPF